MTAKILDGRKIAQAIRQTIAHEIKALQVQYKLSPNITTITVGSDPASELYMKLRNAACTEVGIRTSHVAFPSHCSEDEILNRINHLNADTSVHGILLQFPLPSHLSSQRLISALDPKKDVEGLHPVNMGRALIGDEYLMPCTPLAVLTILASEEVDLKGKHVVIVNHSAIVGKPLAVLLLNRNATVSVCHVFTQDLTRFSGEADILVSAAGVPKLITKDHVKKGAFVIDVGIIQTKDGVCGDVDFNMVKEKAGWITPVPGGVGPVTIACSLKNMVKTFRNSIEETTT